MSEIVRDERWENVFAYFGPESKIDYDIDNAPTVEWWVFSIEMSYKGTLHWVKLRLSELEVAEMPEGGFSFLMNKMVKAMDKHLIRWSVKELGEN